MIMATRMHSLPCFLLQTLAPLKGRVAIQIWVGHGPGMFALDTGFTTTDLPDTEALGL
jgi:hypothetical protein